VERKEVDGRAGSYSSLRPFIERDWCAADRRAPTSTVLKGLPTTRLSRQTRARRHMALAGAEQIARPYVMPPAHNPQRSSRDARSIRPGLKDPALVGRRHKAQLAWNSPPATEALRCCARSSISRRTSSTSSAST